MFAYDSIKSILVAMVYYGVSMCAILFTLLVARKIQASKLGGFLADIGEYTLDVYVIHMFFVRFVDQVSKIMIEDKNFISYIYLLLFAILIVFCIYFIAKHILRKCWLYRVSVGEQ